MSHEAKKTDTDLEAAWVPLRRSSPDPHAPNVPSLPVRLGLGFFTSLALLLTLLVVIPTCLIRYATFGPPLKWQPLKTYIEGRFVYWSGRISDSAYLRPPRPVAKVPKNLPLKWAKEGRKDVEVDVVDIPPLQDGYMKGIGKVEGVKGEQRSGYILTSPRSVGRGKDPAKEGERVVLYFHGGAYGGGHPVQFPFPWQMSKALNCRVIGIQYRLSLSPETAFPAPILDALAGYLFVLIQLHFQPRNITLMGDSSGAHLALCLSRYIHDLNIPHPGHIALTSPLGDCSTSLPSRINLKGIDILASNMDRKPLASATRHFTREAVKNNAYFAPARASAGEWMYLKDGEVKVYIMVGTKEILLDDTMGIVKGMKDAGVDIVLRKDPEGNHCGPLAQWDGSTAWDLWVQDLRQRLHVEA